MQETSKSPRFSRNYTSITDMFQTFDNTSNLTKNDFNLIIKVFFKVMTDATVNEGKIYQIPYRLGTFGVRKRQTVGRGVFDYNLFKQDGTKVWKKNLHSSMFAAKIHWSTKFPSFFIGTLYPYHVFRFTPCREYARYLAKQIREHNTISKYYDY